MKLFSVVRRLLLMCQTRSSGSAPEPRAFVYIPSTWYADVAAPHAKSGGNMLRVRVITAARSCITVLICYVETHPGCCRSCFKSRNRQRLGGGAVRSRGVYVGQDAIFLLDVGHFLFITPAKRKIKYCVWAVYVICDPFITNHFTGLHC